MTVLERRFDDAGSAATVAGRIGEKFRMPVLPKRRRRAASAWA